MVDDFVVRRADGASACRLAVADDDAEQRIGEGVRGDLLDTTTRQLLFARLLRLPLPVYADAARVLGPDSVRLARS